MSDTLTFKCENGTFVIDNIREFRNYSNNPIRQCNITVTNQDTTIDEIEKILTNPKDINDFDIVNSNTGVTNHFEGYSLNNINKTISGNTISIEISFMKGN